jgi:hypothetical protein
MMSLVCVDVRCAFGRRAFGRIEPSIGLLSRISLTVSTAGKPHPFYDDVRDSFGVLSLGSVGFVKRSAQRVRNARN